MAGLYKNHKIGRNFLPFCAGIACGILISVVLFFLFASQALSGHIWFKTNKNFINKNIVEKRTFSQIENLRQGID